jgi:hypothetical protein
MRVSSQKAIDQRDRSEPFDKAGETPAAVATGERLLRPTLEVNQLGTEQRARRCHQAR